MADDISTASILGTRVDPTSYRQASAVVAGWAAGSLSKYVCVATVSQVMEGYDAPEFQAVLNETDLVTPDGMPLVSGVEYLVLERPLMELQINGCPVENGPAGVVLDCSDPRPSSRESLGEIGV